MSLASEVAAAVKIGKEYGWDDVEIFRCIARSVGGDRRREMGILWGDALGMDPKTALQKLHAAGEIPSTAPPRSLREGTLHRIVQEDISDKNP